ncbi:MAG: PAS domain S-box protein, partial [Ignavibacteriales bacterium]|nr:PAS domain S-box protein [Ignavibacteriales bacterium]
MKDLEVLWKKKDSSPIWISLTAHAIKNADGKTLYYEGFVNDITERRRVKEALRESEERFRSLYENSTIGIYRATQDGRILLANPALVRMLGFDSFDELVQRNLEQQGFETKYSRKEFRECIEKENEVKGLESAWTRANGSVRSVRESAKAIKNDEGKVLYYEGTVEDVTERKRAEIALREGEELYRTLASTSPDSITAIDLEGKIIYTSPRSLEIFGYSSKEEVLGRNLMDWISQNDQQRVITNMQQVYTTGIHLNEEYTLLKKDGGSFIAEVNAAVISTADGKPKGIVIVIRDVMEKKNLEQQLLRTQRLENIGTLAGGIAHDLNNVLAPILLSIEVLKKRYPDEKDNKVLPMIESSAKRGKDIIKQVLTFARGAEGQYVTIQMKHLIREMENIIRETFPRSIKLVHDIPNDLSPISGDATQLHQVLLNLCVNARDAMPSGGTLTISAENTQLDESFARMHNAAEPGKYILVKVVDTGVGIPKNIIDKIFEPFFTTKEIGKGTGLGLSTVHSIVKMHGGFVDIESALGKGTTFKVYLPTIEISESLPVLSEETRFPTAKGETILIVDDEASILDINKQTLETYGYKVFTACDGIEAIALFVQKKDNIDVVLAMYDNEKGESEIRKGLRTLKECGFNMPKKHLFVKELGCDDKTWVGYRYLYYFSLRKNSVGING